MKKRDYLQHLSRIAYDVLIALVSGFVLHSIKLLIPVIILWASLLLNSDPSFHDLPRLTERTTGNSFDWVGVDWPS